MSKFFPPLKRRSQYVGLVGVSGHRRFRPEIAEDCLRRCVYCDARDGEIGGDPMMELDHFRPEAHFEELKDDPRNLVYACRSCNGKKRHDWPAGKGETTHVNGAGYIDPFSEDRSKFFTVSVDGEVQGLQPPAPYVIRRLALNRPLLKCLRKRAVLLSELQKRISDMLPRLEKEISRASPEIAPLLEELLLIIQLQKTVNELI